MNAGEKARREVMGDEYVDRAMGATDDFIEPLQAYLNEHCWGSVWVRKELDRRTRSLCTLAMLVALRASNEIRGHVHGALRNGASREEIREVLLHAAVYCGAPAAIEAFRSAAEVFKTREEPGN